MLRALPLLLLTAAAPVQRTHPELSDVALAVAALVAVWFVRRRLRARFRRPD